MRDALSSAVFIDRDGTIMEDFVYCSDPKNVKIFPGVLEALRRLKSRWVQTHHHHKPERHRPRPLYSRAISRC